MKRATIRSLRNTTFTRFGGLDIGGHEHYTRDPQQPVDCSHMVPLAATSFTDNPNFYPRRVDASYAGHTVAIDDGSNNVYTGELRAQRRLELGLVNC